MPHPAQHGFKVVARDQSSTADLQQRQLPPSDKSIEGRAAQARHGEHLIDAVGNPIRHAGLSKQWCACAGRATTVTTPSWKEIRGRYGVPRNAVMSAATAAMNSAIAATIRAMSL